MQFLSNDIVELFFVSLHYTLLTKHSVYWLDKIWLWSEHDIHLTFIHLYLYIFKIQDKEHDIIFCVQRFFRSTVQGIEFGEKIVESHHCTGY